MAGEDALLAWLQQQAATKGGSKQTNNIQDLVSSLFSPEFGALTGSVDPLATQFEPYVPNVPLLTAYTNDPNVDVRNAALRIANGDSPLDVKMELRGKFGLKTEKDITDAGLTIKELDGIVDDMYKEYASNLGKEAEYNAASAKALASNVFGDAMLPQPTERYTLDTMPVTSDLQAMFDRLNVSADKIGAKGKAVQGATDLEKQVMLKYAQENPTPKERVVTPTNESALRDVPLPAFDNYADAVKYGDAYVRGGGGQFGDAWIAANQEYEKFVQANPMASQDEKDAFRQNKWREKLAISIPELGTAIGNAQSPEILKVQDREVSKQNAREDALMLDRAAKSEAKRTVGDDYEKQKKVLLNQVTTAKQKKVGELLALGMLGKTPLLDALKMRTTGLG
jgi:hypothetical protein